MKKEMILVTGANGQIGSVLTEQLREVYGEDQVLATDIRLPAYTHHFFKVLDILNRERLGELAKKYKVTQIYHLAAILSARGELNPRLAWDINMNGLLNVFGVARELGIKVFHPSSIAVFGPHTPQTNTPQYAILDPETIYGITKVAGEHLGQYFYKHFDVDIRSVRYPGIIGYQSMPGGGTTDYAVEIFHKALQYHQYECFLKADTRLPMLYMDDAIRAALEIMETQADNLTIRTAYNITGMSFTPAELTAEIKKHIPDLEVTYNPDFRQQIAESWSESLDDSVARDHWGWKPEYDLAAMTEDMLLNLKKKYEL